MEYYVIDPIGISSIMKTDEFARELAEFEFTMLPGQGRVVTSEQRV